MLRKSLLTSIALFTLHATQGHQMHEQPAPHSNCPPCPCGGVGGWVLIPAGPGMPCNQGATPEEPHHHPHQPAHEIIEQQHYEPVQQHYEPIMEPQQHHEEPQHHHEPMEHKHGLNPIQHPERTLEQEHLEMELQPVKPHIYLRANPHSPDPTKKEGEWGKALNGKVYFRHLGNWVYDPSVNPTTDIVATGVKEKIGFFNNLFKTQQSEPQQEQKPVEAAPTTEPAMPNAVPGNIPPPPPGGPKLGKPAPRKSWPKVNVPDALGTTEGRVQSVYTNPTENNERQFGLGAPNINQTGVTGEAPPRIDVPASANH